MRLEKERKLNYKVSIKKDYPELQNLTIEYNAIDNSKIYAEIVVKKIRARGIILEIPDYEKVPNNTVKLMKYCALGYSGATLHVRGDRGRSENKQPASMYFPFLTNNQQEELYYNYAYQDAIDLVNILVKEFPDLEINIVAKGQGAAIALVVSAISKKISRLFISNVQNVDFKYILDENLDIGVYDSLREYIRNYPEKEEYLLERLEEIDVLNCVGDVEAEINFGYSTLEDEKNIVINKKITSLFEKKNVTIFENEEGDLHEKILELWLMESV
ncbi:acetylxylan esterase [uncultured Gemella sp.]|uniref:acetylxylan esterase n=1 Tax=uncultured Gemella sp. TaxID=254352 RepID=UPI0028D7C137|nr:acetylxylan esterase [uncultured Gemella sp.]